jgi:type I restriction enzyme M protein
MVNSASDGRGSEQAIRQKLIETKAVDVMVAVGPNMFYTVTLPCTLWFFDRGKVGTVRENTVLFLDARHLYRQIDRAHRDLSEAQIGFLANIIRLYRGEAVDVTLGGAGRLSAGVSSLAVMWAWRRGKTSVTRTSRSSWRSCRRNWRG